MKIDILTLFPEMFTGVFSSSIIGRAQEQGLVNINTINIRDFTSDRHRQVDDYPYGGGAGMVMKVDVLAAAIKSIYSSSSHIIYLSPQGRMLNQKKCEELLQYQHLILLCGHYEGIDERVMAWIDEEISIGDYVLTGGELPAMVLTDAITRLLPGVIDQDSPLEESFANDLLEYPQYTRPQAYAGMEVPEVLLSGHHENIRRWRKKQSLLRTLLKRPDLLLGREYDQEERQLLEEILFSGEKTK